MKIRSRCRDIIGQVLALSLVAVLALAGSPCVAGAKGKVTYMVMGDTMEPLMITRPGEPLAGGMFTEIVKLVFEESDVEIQPMVLPWQRIVVELRERNDWLMHGIPAFFEPAISYELSDKPVFPFNHVAISLRDGNLSINGPEDLFGRSVILVENYHYPGLDPFLDKPLVGKGSGKILALRAFDPQGALRMLRHKRGDVVIGYQARMLHHLGNADLELDDVRFQDASNIVPTQNMHIAFSPRMPDYIRRLINERLVTITEDGRLASILERYYGPKSLVE